MSQRVLEPVWIAGVGMTPFGVHLDKSVKYLTRVAVFGALADAGATSTDIGAAYFANTAQGELEGQLAISGHIALRAAGFESIPVVNVESACASGTVALHSAILAVRSGSCDVALAVGAEKMRGADPGRITRLFDGGVDVNDPGDLGRTLEKLGGADNGGAEGKRTIFMDIYAAMARFHMDRFGTTQRQLATVAAKNHTHAVENPRAHYRQAMTVDEVLAGRALGHPLTVPMCSPMTDGAAAAIVCNADGLARLQRSRPIKVLSCVVATGMDRDLDDLDRHITRRGALRAYEEAGVGPADVSVAEVHDAAAFGEIFQTELLGLCELGMGGPLVESGATSLGGRIPVNPSGGLESKGHPIGATGLGQTFELVNQLRGEAGVRQVPGARIAVAENGGGLHGGEEAVVAITVLGI